MNAVAQFSAGWATTSRSVRLLIALLVAVAIISMTVIAVADLVSSGSAAGLHQLAGKAPGTPGSHRGGG